MSPRSLAVLLFCLPALAADEWVRVQSQNFDLYTSAGEKSGRAAVQFFEQVRAFFDKFGRQQSGRPAVRVMAFKSEKDYDPYRSGSFAAAYYVGTEKRDFIVMQKFGSDDTRAVVLHEYTHLIVNQTRMKIPAWLNEGLAEVFSTLRPAWGKVMIGNLIPGRFQTVHRAWLPLPALLAADRESVHYNDKEKAAIFYAESWLLAHMLYLSEEYEPKFSAFLAALSNGAKAEEAFPKVYGKTVAEVERDLQAYRREDRFRVAVFETKLEKMAQEPVVSPVSALERDLLFADTLHLAGKRDEARHAYTALLVQHPKSWEVAAGAAAFHLRRGNPEEARQLFRQSMDLGCRDGDTLLDYGGLLLRSGDDAGAAEALGRALEAKPDLRDAHYYLGFVEMRRRNYKQALHHLQSVKRIEAERAAGYFRALAHAQAETGDRQKARKSAELGKQYAKTPSEIAEYDRLLRYLSEEPSVRASAPAPRVFQEVAEAPEPPPALDRPPAPAEPETPPPPRYQSIEGVMESLECAGAPRLIVRAGNQKYVFTFRSPDTVTLRNAPAGTLDFTCGPQPKRKVIIEYDPEPNATPGITGDVRGIEFQ